MKELFCKFQIADSRRRDSQETMRAHTGRDAAEGKLRSLISAPTVAMNKTNQDEVRRGVFSWLRNLQAEH